MIRILRLDKFSALYLWALFMIYFGLTKRDTFFSSATFKLVIQENIIIGVLAVAFLIPLAAGTYDLSIGAMMSFALVISATFAQNKTMPNAAGMFVALIICGVAGAVSGFFVVKLKVNSFIATLGMSQVLSALVLFTSSQSITGAFTESFMNLGADTFLGLARYVWYFVTLAVIVWFVLEHTPTGRYMYAVGGNPEAARLAGVKTDRLIWGSLVVSAVIAGFAGVIYSWKVGSYDESVGPGYLFPAVAAVFFGASQLKGRANLWGTVIALYSLAWGVQGLELTFISSSSWISPLFQGISLLVAVALASHRGVVRVRRRSTKADTPAPPAAGAADAAQEHREQTV
jgi:ribose transport system permease protein